MQLAAACILIQWKVIIVVVSLVKDSGSSPQVPKWCHGLHCFSGSECCRFQYKHVCLALRNLASKAYS